MPIAAASGKVRDLVPRGWIESELGTHHGTGHDERNQ
jgi:hypothetical protein